MNGMWRVLGRCCVDALFRGQAHEVASEGHAVFHAFIHEEGKKEKDKVFKRLSIWEAGDLRRILTDPKRSEYLDKPLSALGIEDFPGEPDWFSMIGLSLIDTPFRMSLMPRRDEDHNEYVERVMATLDKYGFELSDPAAFDELEKLYGNPDGLAAMYNFNIYFWIYPECEPKISTIEEEGDYVHVHCRWEQKLREAANAAGARGVELDMLPPAGSLVEIEVP